MDASTPKAPVGKSPECSDLVPYADPCTLLTLHTAPEKDVLEHEAYWIKVLRDRLAAKNMDAQAEYVLPDGSRVDILTDVHAIEVEWAWKWKEAIGQSLFYALSTQRAPRVWLLRRGPVDDKYYLRCLMVCVATGIELTVESVIA